jgi:hypothetical protein
MNTSCVAGLRLNDITSIPIRQVLPFGRIYFSTSILQTERNVFNESEARDALKLPSSADFLGVSSEGRKAQMQELAMKLQSLRDPKIYRSFVRADGKGFNDKLMLSTIKVVNFYTNPTTVLPLQMNGSTGKNETQFKRSLVLSGPEFCHSLITTVILPHFGQCDNLTPKQFNGLMRIAFRIIQALGKLSMNLNQQSWKNNLPSQSNLLHRPSGTIQLGDLAETLLRQILNAPISVEGTSGHDHDESRTAKVTSLYNNTLNTWSVIAATEKDPMIAKDAALRAERLLLDLAMSRSGNAGNDNTMKGNTDPKSTLLQYLEPDVVSFNTTIKAWSKSGRFEKIAGQKVDVSTGSAAERSEAILKLLQDLNDEARGLDYNDSILPDRMSYESVIQAWSRAHDPQATVRATKILEDMVERYNKAYSEDNVLPFNHTNRPPFPSRQTFSSVLTTLARTSFTNPTNAPSNNAIEHAESLFRQMKKLGNDGYEQNKPDTIAYNALLQVYANQVEILLTRKKHNAAAIKNAFDLCNRMEAIVAEMVAVSSSKGDSITNEEPNPDFTTHKVALLTLIRVGSNIMNAKKNQKITIDANACALRAKSHLKELTLTPSLGTLHLQAVKDLMNIFASIGDTEKMKDVYDLFSILQSRSQSPSQVSSIEYEEILDLLLKSRNGRLVVADLEKSINKNMGFRPSRRMLNSLIEANATLASDHINYARLADRIMTSMIDRYKDSYAIISKGNGTLEHYKVPRPNTFTLHSVVAAYADACGNRALPSKSRVKAIQRIEEILAMMEDMHKDNMNPGTDTQVTNYTAAVRPNVKTYNILLHAYNSRTKFVKDINDVKLILEKSEMLIKRMDNFAQTGENESAKPDHYTYASLLNIVAQSKLPDAPEKARVILQRAFANNNGSGDIIVFNTALKVISGTTESVKEVLDLYERLENGSFGAGLEPDKFTFSIVMAALGKEGTIEAAQKVESLYHRMNKRFDLRDGGPHAARSIKPDIYCYNSIISAWSNVKTAESCQRAENHLDSLLQATTGIKADGSSFSSLIYGHSQRSDSAAACDCERVLEKKEAYQRLYSNIPINFIDYNLTIKKYSEEMNPGGCFRVLERLLKHMEVEGITKPVNIDQLVYCFNSTMNSYNKASVRDSASKIQEIFDLMVSSTSSKPDRYSYALLMNAHAQSRSKNAFKIVDNLLEQILQENSDGKKAVQPTITVFNLLFKACELTPPCNNPDENPVTTAFERFGLIQASNTIRLNHHTYSHMFAICRNHVQDEGKRDQLVSRLFQKCCHDGQLSELALTLCRDSISPKKFENVVSSIVGEKVSPLDVCLRDFPQTCKRNVSPPKHVRFRRY